MVKSMVSVSNLIRLSLKHPQARLLPPKIPLLQETVEVCPEQARHIRVLAAVALYGRWANSASSLHDTKSPAWGSRGFQFARWYSHVTITIVVG